MLDYVQVFSAGDELVVTFDIPTNAEALYRSATLGTVEITALLTFSQSIGTSFSGSVEFRDSQLYCRSLVDVGHWSTIREFIITITDATGGDPSIGRVLRHLFNHMSIDKAAGTGVLVATVRPSAGLRNAAQTSLASQSTSPSLIGDWGDITDASFAGTFFAYNV